MGSITPINQNDPDDIVTAKEVAAFLKIAEGTVLRMARQRLIPSVPVQCGGKTGHKLWRFKMSQIREWVNRQAQGGAA